MMNAATGCLPVAAFAIIRKCAFFQYASYPLLLCLSSLIGFDKLLLDIGRALLVTV